MGEKTLPPRRNRQLKKRLMSPVAKRTNQAPKLPTIQRLLDNALSTAGVFIEAPVYVPEDSGCISIQPRYRLYELLRVILANAPLYGPAPYRYAGV